jgi:hypothetical protein
MNVVGLVARDRQTVKPREPRDMALGHGVRRPPLEHLPMQ